MNRRQAEGLTLPELVAVVAIITVGASLALGLNGREIRRERINAATVGLSGWIEEVRRSALKAAPCTLTINSNLTGATSGAAIGSAVPEPAPSGASAPADACQSLSPYRLPTELGSSRVTVEALSGASFTFGVLGTVSPTTPVEKEWILTLLKSNGQSDLSRCLRIRGMMGFVEIGNRNGGSCSYASRY